MNSDPIEPVQRKLAIRLFDLLLSLIGLVIVFPLILAIYVSGLLINGSPLFFQKRVGKNQKLFTLVKFRTMTKGTVSVGTHDVDAAAITGFGKFLRKTKLDELPQLINVVLGQMSMVGPRPCLPTQTELVEERVKRGVYSVRPGITGLAQVHEVDMSTPRKLARYDALMINNLTVRCYLYLIFATAVGKGAGDRVRAS